VVAIGQELELSIEKPAHGGRMIARRDGQVVLVRGAIPGERVLASVERVESRLAFATTIDVLEPSADRRQGLADPRCGGCLFSHIGYPRQLTIKGEVAADAFARLGRIPLDSVVPIGGSPERGYRTRARFHVGNGRAGFYREGTHEICDVAQTGQLTDSAVLAVHTAVASLVSSGLDVQSLELSENIAGDMRVAAFDLLRAPAGNLAVMASHTLGTSGLTGCTLRLPGGERVVAGTPTVTDTLMQLTRGRAVQGSVSRHAESFFQANRFLIGDLVAAVLDAVPPDDDLFDFYAGVGLFSVALAATARVRITAVEGDRSSGADLLRNAGPFGSTLRVVLRSVEDFLGSRGGTLAGTAVVDPPRTGVSRQAMHALASTRLRTIIYVSCDPATMARDARRLLDAGFSLVSLRGFDLFPNTPHFELIGVFARSG
jgi:23S rRNA (uracil1939-C5)-methyltransferase